MRLVSADAIRISRYNCNKKSLAAAYAVWFFLGCLGGHRLYLQRRASALVMLGLLILSALTVLTDIGLTGFIGFGAIGIWMLVDAFLIPRIVRNFNDNLAAAVAN